MQQAMMLTQWTTCYKDCLCLGVFLHGLQTTSNIKDNNAPGPADMYIQAQKHLAGWHAKQVPSMRIVGLGGTLNP